MEAATRGFTAVLDAAGTAYRARFAGGLVATVVRRRRDADDDHHRQGEGGGGGTTDAFYLELQLLARLNHRHVVRLRGFALAHHARPVPFRPPTLSSFPPHRSLSLLLRIGEIHLWIWLGWGGTF